MHLRPATLNDLDAARALFKQYPYKSVQAIAQKLDRERLIAFYLTGLRSALEKGIPHWIVEDPSGQPLGLAGLAPDPWHSGVYGFPMGKVAPILGSRTASSALNAECGMRNAEFLGARASSPALEGGENAKAIADEAVRDPRGPGPLLLSALDSAARTQGLQHLSARIDGEDFANLHLFESAGWLLVDVSLKFTRPMTALNDFAPPAAAAGWNIDLAGPADAAWIRTLGSQTHAGTHFLNDPALPAEKTRELFARWLDRCLEGLAYKVYVLADPAGAGRGFVTYLRSPGFARAVGRAPLILDFVLIDPALRGGGFGPWLVAETLARESAAGFDYCELRTSAHNLAAVMTYEKLGFRCCASDFVLHKWLVS